MLPRDKGIGHQLLTFFVASSLKRKCCRPRLAGPKGAPATSFDSLIPLPTATAATLACCGRLIGAG